MTLTEKAAYLKGIADGMKLSAEEPADKLLLTIVDLLGEMAQAVSENEDDIALLTEDVDALFSDVYDDDIDFDDDDEEDDDEELYEIECPKCGETIYLDFDEIEQGDLTCPACGELLDIELHLEDECDCDDDGCECCHHEHGADEK